MPFNIQKANQIHNNKYDYSKVNYIDVMTKVEIICPVHGSFWQSPKIHIYSKGGCKQCANDRITGTFDTAKAHKVHDHKYDYSKVVYKNVDTKVEIICPDHGSFMATPDKHISVKTGCPKCKGEKQSKERSLTKQQFIEQAIIAHGDCYDYSEVQVINSHTKVKIICNLHGAFYQTPTNHYANKNGCPSCGRNVSVSGKRWLDAIATPNTIREHVLFINGRKFKVDGFDPSTNTIYEYFGVFWHGCPTYCDHTKSNPRNKVPYKILYERTLERIEIFHKAGYILVSEWGK